MKHNTKNKVVKKSRFILDQTDEIILHCLERNPQIILKQIPRKIKEDEGLSISYPTVQRRVRKLTTEGILERDSYRIDWVRAGYLVRYRVGILIDPSIISDNSKNNKNYNSQEGLADYISKEIPLRVSFKNKLLIEDVHILLGGNVDLAVDFYAKDDKTATNFIIEALRNLPGIRNTISAKLAYSSNHGWLSKNGEK